MKLGFIGLGIMGRPMAKNLLKKKDQPGSAAGTKASYLSELLVSDLNKEAVADVVAAGAREATYAEIGAECSVIITMVPNGAIVQDILFGENWNNPDIDLKTKSLLTVVILVAQGITDDSLKHHIENAKN